jgi:hypothetical protein
MVDLLCQKTKSSFKERFFTNRGMTDRQTELKHKVKMKEKYFGMNVKMNCHAFKNGSK